MTEKVQLSFVAKFRKKPTETGSDLDVEFKVDFEGDFNEATAKLAIENEARAALTASGKSVGAYLLERIQLKRRGEINTTLYNGSSSGKSSPWTASSGGALNTVLTKERNRQHGKK